MFELVQVHECGSYAEVVILDADRRIVYAGNIDKQPNPGAYMLPKNENPDTQG